MKRLARLLTFLGIGAGRMRPVTTPLILTRLRSSRPNFAGAPVDPDMVNMMRTLGASRWQIFTKLQVPSALPQMFSGIKIGIAVSVIGAVIGEWVGASAGLGYLMTYSQPLFLTARVFAAIVVLSAMGIGLFVLATLAERIMLPWYHTEKRARSMERI